MQATVKTTMSNVLVWLRWRILMCLMVMGSLLGQWVDWGAILATPFKGVA